MAGITGNRHKLAGNLFISPEKQLSLVRERNLEREWGFSEKDFDKLGSPPAWPQKELSAVVLDVSLDTIQATLDEGWHFAASLQSRSWRWEEVKSDPEHLSLLKGITFVRGLRWVTVNLARHWDKNNGVKPPDVWSHLTSPHSAILWAASYFPKWVQAMDGINVPFIWIPGYQIKVDGFSCDPRALNFVWCHACQRLELYVSFADHRCVAWAVPSFA